jgi:hypothetical protein
MGASIECRVPFLDYRLVVGLGALPSSALLSGRRGKRLLLDAVGERLPDEIKQAGKRGFSVPWRRYLRDEPELRDATMAAHARHQELTTHGANIAASGNPDYPKCLHAHAAFELAMGDHPLGARVLEEAQPNWCADGRCRSFLPE